MGAVWSMGRDHKRNLVATERDSKGDVDAVMADCDVVVDHVYHTKAFNQAMMETIPKVMQKSTAMEDFI